jgi:hypothetical protein
MNTIFGNFLERTIPSLKGTLISLNMGNTTSEMNLEDFKALMAPEPTPIPEPSYKVFTALVTQSGSDNQYSIDTGLLTIGVTYRIENSGPPSGNWDFTNVGAPNNDYGTSFIATGTTPNSWGVNIILIYNTGAPVVNVLENTIGNVWFTYEGNGAYSVRSNSLFTSNKTVNLNDQTRCLDSGNNFYNLKITNSDPGQINITVLNNDLDGTNDRLTSKLIEIRVYN